MFMLQQKEKGENPDKLESVNPKAGRHRRDSRCAHIKDSPHAAVTFMMLIDMADKSKLC